MNTNYEHQNVGNENFEICTFAQMQQKVRSECQSHRLSYVCDRRLGGGNFLEWTQNGERLELYIEAYSRGTIVDYVNALDRILENTNYKIDNESIAFHPNNNSNRYAGELEVVPRWEA